MKIFFIALLFFFSSPLISKKPEEEKLAKKIRNERKQDIPAKELRRFGIEVGSRMVDIKIPELSVSLGYNIFSFLNINLSYNFLEIPFCTSGSDFFSEAFNISCITGISLNISIQDILGQLRLHLFKNKSFIIGIGLGYRIITTSSSFSALGREISTSLAYKTFFIQPGLGIFKVFSTGFSVALFIGYEISITSGKTSSNNLGAGDTNNNVVTGLENTIKKDLDKVNQSGFRTIGFKVGAYFLF